MGVPSSGGDTGRAVGRIEIDTRQAQQAPGVMAGVAQGIERNMAQINASAARAGGSFGALAGAVRGVGAAFGIGLGAQALGQLGRMAMAAADTATAYERQGVAARGLAGSQQQLNKLLEAYDNATGDAIDNATALANVTRLQAVGFADSAQELEQVARAIRGVSLAMGSSQDYVAQQLQLAIANQSTLRLDQLGLGVKEVQQRIAELRAENRGLTQEMAYQNAVLGLIEEKFGALADSAAGQASGTEKLRRAWKDFGTQLSVVAGGPINAIAGFLAKGFEAQEAQIKSLIFFLKMYEDGLRRIGVLGKDLSGISSRTSIGRVRPQSFGDDSELAQRQQAKVDFVRDVEDINERLYDEIVDAERSYGQQRQDAIEGYQQSIAREAQDFALQRTRQEQDLADIIAGIREDAARREERMALDLGRTIANARQASADRIADLEEQHARTIAERRADSADRIAEWEEDRNEKVIERRREAVGRMLEMEEDFANDRERAMRDSRDRLHSAAAQFDAFAIAQEQRRFAREEEERNQAHAEELAGEQEKLDEGLRELERAHDDRLAEERESLEKSLAQQQAAHNRQVADEKEALDQRILQAQEAHALQLEEARAADAERISDMQADLVERQRREDEDRRIRLGRMAEDHQDQLNEMAEAHGDRIEQIQKHAREEREELNEAHKQEMIDLGHRNDAWLEELRRLEEERRKIYDEIWNPANAPGMVQPPFAPGADTPIYPTPSGEPLAGASSVTTTSTSMGGVTINIYPTGGQSATDIAKEVDRILRGFGSDYPQ
jgi:hypothetical protein